MAALTVGGAFLSASLQVLFDKLTSPSLHEFGSVWGVEHELTRLRRTLLKILSVMGSMEMREIRDQSMQIWLKELKDVAYDADDILDEFEAEVLRQHVNRINQVSYFSLIPNQVIFRHEISKKINTIRERLDDAARDRDDLRLGDLKHKTIGVRESSSLVAKSCVFGREDDAEKIVEMLISEDTNRSTDMNVHAMLIAGMGGIGKTTLAKLVYNDERIDSYFQLKMWVHVSQEFSVKKITREMTEFCSKGRGNDLGNWNLVQENLKEELQGKRLLLVLDDVWSVDQYEWEQLCLPLTHGAGGSKILITTRNTSVAKETGTMAVHCLECLSDEHCLQIFRKHAFPSGIGDGLSKLEEISKEVVHKLKGLPLAAKALGGLLCSSHDEDHWRNILESEIWELPPKGTSLLSALRLSYQHLPAHLKQCFAYCSLFPKDFEFNKAKLIQIWIAQGFIQPQGRRRMEDVGKEFFDELLDRAFFQKIEESHIMHDMIHDLARFFSLDECFNAMNGKLQQIPENARHLSLVSDNLHPSAFQELTRFKSLRSLLFLRECKPGFDFIPEELFIRLRYIRVLDLSCNNIRVLPNSIGNLKLLRYLDLSRNSISQLPESIGSLHNLQTLKLEACPLLQLPKAITNLIKLRHLKVDDDDLVSSIARVGRLINLQELVKFKVQKEAGRRIEELKDMTELQSIHILELENVIRKEEAIDAVLNDKKYLRILTLEWSYNREARSAAEFDGEILEGLRPHPNLKELNIWDNYGFTYPGWLRNQFLSNLEVVSLRNCKNWEILPSLGQLRFLRYLEISGIDRIKQVNHQFYGNEENKFPSLVELRFVDMPEWEEWLCPQEGQLFPCLQELLVVSCPKLLELPSLPSTLARLWIRKVGLRTLPNLLEQSEIEEETCLTTLEIVECPNLTSLQEGLLRHHLTALESLTIIDCPDIMHSPVEGGFPALAPVKSLTIENCPKLTSLFDSLPPLLADLRIGGCPDFRIRCLQNLSCLYSMSIFDCPNISSLPEEVLCNLIALEELTVSGCTELISLQFQALVSLKRLTIENCPMLKSSSLQPSSSLEYLEISNTPEVAEFLQNLTSLLSLRLHNCPQLTSFIREEEELQKLRSLQSLHIIDCVNLRSLPTTLHHLTSLERLYLQNCPHIQTLPENGLPSSLSILDIRECPGLEVRCQKDSGLDWNKVAHIPNVYTTSSKLNMNSGPEEGQGTLASTSSAATFTETRIYDGLLY